MKLRALEAHRSVTVASLFTSASTLLCCALPAAMVAVGGGAAMVALVGAVPQLVWLSEHKEWLFLIAGALLAAAGVLQWRARSLPCPIDPALARSCLQARALSRRVWWVSVGTYLVGALFAFVLPALQQAV